MKVCLFTFAFCLFTFAFLGCGEETDLSQFPINQEPGVIGDTTYIPISPAIFGFNEPNDIHMGNEPLIYVADKGNNRIVQLDISGALVSYSQFILKPRKITQDRNYDLLVVASIIDTIPPNILDTVDAVYRYKLQPAGGLISGVTPTIAFKSNQPTPVPGDHGKLTSVATYQNNYYLVSRSGPNNTSFIDPDNAIFKIDRFDNTNPVPERLTGFELVGQGLLSLIDISGIVTFPYSDNEFFYVQNSSNVVFKANWVLYDEIENIYTAKFSPGSGVDLLRNGLFISPEDVTLDGFNNIYIIDSQKDSLYKFNPLGILQRSSFGGTGTSMSQFMSPMGVAHFNKTLFICDTGNNRILKFILSTDIN